jgi:hypothetical protein
MNRKICWIILFAASTLVLTACHKFQATTRIDPNGGGELRTEAGFTAEERQNMDQGPVGSTPDNFCNIPPDQGLKPSDVTVTEEQRGDETWCVTTTKFDTLDELRRVYETNKGLTVNRLEIDSGTLYYDVDIDTSSRDSDFSGFSSITWTLVTPGRPGDNNADDSQSNTLTWEMTRNSGVINLRAESTVEGAGPGLPLVVGGVIVVCLAGAALLVGVGVYLGSRRSRRPAQ